MSSDDHLRVKGGSILEETAEELYEQAPCGYLSTRPDGTIVRVNQTLLDWIGASRDAMVGQTRFQALLTIGSRIYYETHYAPLLQMQGFANEIALDMRRADGRPMPVVANARQLRDDRGLPLLNRITLFDSTDRRQYERELLLARRNAEQAAKDKADLLAMLSHDIRNPLNAITGVVRMLSQSDLGERQRRLVDILTSSSRNMLTLLDHVLVLSRAESGHFALVEMPFSLSQLIEDVVSIFQARAREKEVNLSHAVDERVPAVVCGDPIAIRQIVTNLVDNAVKFTEHGHVIVTVNVRDLATDVVRLEFTVSDSGIGISPEAAERIFEDYTQGSHDTRVKFGGSGLGLSITRRLLMLYGTQVRLDSVPGEGSRFAFELRLPLPREPVAV